MKKKLIEEIYLKMNESITGLKDADEKLEEMVKAAIKKIDINEIILEDLEELFMDISTASLKEGFLIGYKFAVKLLLESIMED